MQVQLNRVMRLFTTPRELRRIADAMERRWPELMLGDSKVVYATGDGDVGLEIVIDQDRMESEAFEARRAETKGRQ